MSDRSSPLDVCWLQMEAPENPMMVTAVLTLGAPVPFAALTDLLRDRLVARFPRFSRRIIDPPLGVGVGHWEPDPRFDLRRHVHRVGLPSPGGREALQDLVSDLMSTQLDLRRSPWDMHLVEGVDGGAAIIARIHHCVADGISLARVLLSLADGAPAPEPAAPDDLLHRARALATRARAAASALAHPADLARWATTEVGTAFRLVALPPDPDTPLRGKLGVRKVCAWSEPIPLDRVKAIGRAHGATVNDVLLASLAGALRRWLLARGAGVDALRVFVPVNLRPLDQPIPPDLGNEFTLVVVELPIGVADARDRIAAVHARMEALRHSADPEVVYALLSAMGATPPAVERWFVDFLGHKATAVVTNVPGPRAPLTLAGAPLDGVLVWVPQSGNVALGVSILSYAGRVVVGVATDEGILPRPAEIVDGICAEIDEMGAA